MRNKKKKKEEDAERKQPIFNRSGTKPADDLSGGGLNVTVSIPKTLEIRMVDASILSDYELWMVLTTILSSAFVGFLVTAVQSYHEVRLWIDTGIFGVLFAISLVTAVYKRSRVWRRSRSILLQTTPRLHSSSLKHYKNLPVIPKSWMVPFRKRLR